MLSTTNKNTKNAMAFYDLMLNLETAVGRMRVCDLWACQQGATTTQASPCEEAQRRWEAQKLYNRIRSALTQLVKTQNPRHPNKHKPLQHIQAVNCCF